VCLWLATSARPGGALVLVVLATVALTGAEIAGTAAEWALSASGVHAERLGAYVGVFGLSSVVQRVAGPTVVVVVVDHRGFLAWGLLALAVGTASVLLALAMRAGDGHARPGT